MSLKISFDITEGDKHTHVKVKVPLKTIGVITAADRVDENSKKIAAFTAETVAATLAKVYGKAEATEVAPKDQTPAAFEDGEAAESIAPEANRYISVTLFHASKDTRVQYRVNRYQTLRPVFESYANRLGIRMDHLFLLHKGLHVETYNTPAYLGIGDGAELEVALDFWG